MTDKHIAKLWDIHYKCKPYMSLADVIGWKRYQMQNYVTDYCMREALIARTWGLTDR